MNDKKSGLFSDPTVIVIAGVSGTGKSTVGALLAHRLHMRFLDADTLHAPQSIEKMRAGVPLTDTDRRPWLMALAECIYCALERGETLVLACSALKRSYRRIMDPNGDGRVLWVFLQAPPDLISERLTHRIGHFMNSALLQDQLNTLEPAMPEENAITVSVAASPEEIVTQITSAIGPR